MRALLTAAAAALAIGLSAQVTAQSSCNDIMCPNGAQSTGDFPECFCGLDRVERREPSRGPTCADVLCRDSRLVGIGEWPACTCHNPSDPLPPPGSGGGGRGGFVPGLGGVETCKEHFTCPPKFEMAVDEHDTCVCKPD